MLAERGRGTGYREIGDDLLGKIKRQLKLATLGQLTQLVDCTMSGEGYVALLRKAKQLPEDTTAD